MIHGNSISGTYAARVSALSFFAAIAVCSFHIPWQEDTVWLKLFFSVRLHLGALALCFFFVSSGCFLAQQARCPGWWWRAVRRDAVNWLVPYFALPAICIAVIALLHLDLGYLFRENLFYLFGLKPCCSPYFYSLWFLRSLFLFVLVSPVVVRIILAGYGIPLLVFLVSCVACFDSGVVPAAWSASVEATRIYGFFYYTFNIIGFTAFSFGIYLAQRPVRRLGLGAVRLCGVVALLFVVLQVVLMFFGIGCWDLLACLLATPFLLVYVWFRMPDWKLPRIFRGTALSIYLLHLLVIKVYCSFRQGNSLGFLECLLLFFLSLGISILVGKSLKRWFRVLLALPVCRRFRLVE